MALPFHGGFAGWLATNKGLSWRQITLLIVRRHYFITLHGDGVAGFATMAENLQLAGHIMACLLVVKADRPPPPPPRQLLKLLAARGDAE